MCSIWLRLHTGRISAHLFYVCIYLTSLNSHKYRFFINNSPFLSPNSSWIPIRFGKVLLRFYVGEAVMWACRMHSAHSTLARPISIKWCTHSSRERIRIHFCMLYSLEHSSYALYVFRRNSLLNCSWSLLFHLM